MNKYLIVSFCGGGIRGYMSARMLQRLLGAVGAATPFYKQAQMLAGTSTGAQIVSMLLAGLSVDEIVQDYLLSVAIFRDPNTTPSQPAYLVQNLADRQNKLWPTLPTLLDITKQTGQDVLLTSFSVGGYDINTKKGVPWATQLLSNLVAGSQSCQLADAVVQSSAMPGMYGSWKGGIDGAYVNHDPTLAAISLAVQKGVPLEQIGAICFDTGYMPCWLVSDTSQWGAAQWMNGAGNPDDHIPPHAQINSGPSPLVCAATNGTSTTLMPTLSGNLLGARYAYLNAELPSFIAENDIDAFGALKTAADSVSLGQAQSVLDWWQSP